MIAMVDMRIGNLQSVRQAFTRIGTDLVVTNSGDDIARAAAVILPGVGAFGDGAASLRQFGLIDPLRHAALVDRKPFLGICLGMQLMADEGEEHGRHLGLGLVRGRVVRLPPTPGHRIPNMGWCDVTVVNRASRLFAGTQDGEPYYFAHSYHLECGDPADVVATIDYAAPLTAAIERDHIFGVQFHPEKSQDAGLNLLAAFCAEVNTWSVRA
jgi:imidazole glycerol-phosphate synthase subunit HisH